MNVHRSTDRDEHSSRRHANNEGLPPWVTIVVVLWLMAMMTYTTVRFGLDGYPFTMFFGGLLGAYAGIDRAVRRRQRMEQESSGGDRR